MRKRRVVSEGSQFCFCLFYGVGEPIGEGMIAASPNSKNNQPLFFLGPGDQRQRQSKEGVSGRLHVFKLSIAEDTVVR